MFTHTHRWPLVLKLGTALSAAVLLCPLLARAQPPANGSGSRVVARDLMREELIGMPSKEVVVSTVEIPPGHSSQPHRHNAQVFVYELQGTMIMQVKGGPRVTLSPGQMFYENPSDIHTVSANASKAKPAKFLALEIKDKGKSDLLPVAPDEAQSASASGGQAASEPAATATSPESMQRDIIGLAGKEMVVATVEEPPGAVGKPHRHNAQVFVYVLQGRVIMGVKGGPRRTLGPGQTFYENPSDIHSVDDNASKSKPAKFLAFLIKDKGQSGMVPVAPDSAP